MSYSSCSKHIPLNIVKNLLFQPKKQRIQLYQWRFLRHEDGIVFMAHVAREGRKGEAPLVHDHHLVLTLFGKFEDKTDKMRDWG